MLQDTKQNVYSILLYCFSHYVPLTSQSNEDGKLAFPNYPFYPSISPMIYDLKMRYKMILKRKLEGLILKAFDI